MKNAGTWWTVDKIVLDGFTVEHGRTAALAVLRGPDARVVERRRGYRKWRAGFVFVTAATARVTWDYVTQDGTLEGNGGESALDAFCEDNADALEDISGPVRALGPGESHDFGGGASPRVRVTRVR